MLKFLVFGAHASKFESPLRGLRISATSESGKHMASKPFGQPLRRPVPVAEVTSTDGEEKKPGLGWQISAETRREIEEIEANSRTAEQQSGSVVFG